MKRNIQNQNYFQVQDSEEECSSIQKAFFKQEKKNNQEREKIQEKGNYQDRKLFFLSKNNYQDRKNIQGKSTDQERKDNNIQQIISQNHLKKIALSKAEALIAILTIEVDRLQKQKLEQGAFYQNQLKKMKQIFQKKQVFFNEVIQSLKLELKQYKHQDIYGFSKQFYKSCQKNRNLFNNNNQYLSRQFTSGKKIKKKLIQTNSQDLKCNQNHQQNMTITDQLSLAFYIEELQLSQNYLHSQQEYQDQIKMMEQLTKNYHLKVQQIKNLYQNEQFFFNSKKSVKKQNKLFNKSYSSNKNWRDEVKQQNSSLSDILKEYAQLLQQYKQYAAYLKAYLCSSLNFINKITQSYNYSNSLSYDSIENSNLIEESYDNYHIMKEKVQQSFLSTQRTDNYVVNIPDSRIFNIIIKRIINIFKNQQNKKIIALESQNKQLKNILDELVLNLKQRQLKKSNQNNLKATENKNFQRKIKNMSTLTQQNQDE